MPFLIYRCINVTNVVFSILSENNDARSMQSKVGFNRDSKYFVDLIFAKTSELCRNIFINKDEDLFWTYHHYRFTCDLDEWIFIIQNFNGE